MPSKIRLVTKEANVNGNDVDSDGDDDGDAFGELYIHTYVLHIHSERLDDYDEEKKMKKKYWSREC